MKGRYIQVPATTGELFQAYLATSVDGRGPGIVLCQEIFGVNQAMRETADLLAEEGYTVLVPDLYWRQERGVDLGYDEADFARAFSLYQGFDEALGVEDIGATLKALDALDACEGELGVVGYCLGGKLAYLAGCRLPQVACAVGYYGVGIEKALHEAEGLGGRRYRLRAKSWVGTVRLAEVTLRVAPKCGLCNLIRMFTEVYDLPASKDLVDRAVSQEPSELLVEMLTAAVESLVGRGVRRGNWS